MQKEDQHSEKEGSPVFSSATTTTEDTTQISDDKQSLPDATPPLSPDSSAQAPLLLQQPSTLKNASWANVVGQQRDKPVKLIKKRESSKPIPSTKVINIIHHSSGMID